MADDEVFGSVSKYALSVLKFQITHLRTNRLMQLEVTQYLMRATAELAELLGIAV